MTKDDEIKRLSDYSHARLRTETYFGSRSNHTQSVLMFFDGNPVVKEMTWVPALLTAVREIIDNALDEIVGKGFGDRIDVMYDPNTMTFTVKDNGRGIPIDIDPEFGGHKATMVLTEARAGRNFDDSQRTGAGMNGVGGSICNFCSEFFEVEITRDKKKFTQKFTEGNAVDDSLQIFPPKVVPSSAKSGTTITFRPSVQVFKNLTLPSEFIESRLLEIAACNPKLKVFFNGERIQVKQSIEKTLFAGKKPISIKVTDTDFETEFFVLPNIVRSGDHVHSLVNNVPTFDGGEHVDEFKRTFVYQMLKALEKPAKKQKLSPNRSDLLEGVLFFSVTKMRAPYFGNQAKTKLINEEVKKPIKTHLDNEEIFKQIVSNNKQWVDEILERTAIRTQKKDASDISSASKKLLRVKIPSLMEATSKLRSDCILMLAEGDSAIAGFAEVRNPKIHGGLPLRGKIMNVNGENPKKVLTNQALANIMNSLGLEIGKKASRLNLQYGKVYIACDMDTDGANITALLVNFFYKFWPELFDAKNPCFYIFLTPFIIVEKGKERHYWYNNDYDQFNPEDWKGATIRRAKGLGTLRKENWKHAIAEPRLIELTDDGGLEGTLDLIFNGSRADDRKSWMAK
jgi:DNA gyrase/topoisomerase IV subunit B